MAENLQPNLQQQELKLNLAMLATSAKKQRSSLRPMTTERIGNHTMAEDELKVDTGRLQLISPPPEESLRRAPRQTPFTPSLLANNVTASPGNATLAPFPTSTKAKRKRAQQTPRAHSAPDLASSPLVPDDYLPQPLVDPQTVGATPNPKPRKQVRRQATMDSPTRAVFTQDEDVQMLLSTPSRKKTSLGGADGTASMALMKSPHAKNPDADYIPPVIVPLGGEVARRKLLGVGGRRRSATPIPPYEPPTDVFTPPREVFVSPPHLGTGRKSGKAGVVTPAGKGKGRGKKAGVGLTPIAVVKQEMPDIDLSIPMPPPSPTDDPLLLSSDLGWGEEVQRTPGREEGKKNTVKKGKSKAQSQTPARAPVMVLESTSTREAAEVVMNEVRRETTKPKSTATMMDDDLPPSSPPPPFNSDDDDEGGPLMYDWTAHHTEAMASTEEDSMMQVDPADVDVEPVRLFDFEAAVGEGAGGWSDTDEEESGGGRGDEAEGRGEYTGRWKMMKVRTKADPPSSATRGRMEEWGRPISPFPKVKKLVWGVGRVEEEREEELGVADGKGDDDETEEEEVRRMSVEPEEEDVVQQEEEQTVSLPVQSEQVDVQEASFEEEQEGEDDAEEREVRELSVEQADQEDDEAQQHEEESFTATSSHAARAPTPPRPSVSSSRSKPLYEAPRTSSIEFPPHFAEIDDPPDSGAGPSTFSGRGESDPRTRVTTQSYADAPFYSSRTQGGVDAFVDEDTRMAESEAEVGVDDEDDDDDFSDSGDLSFVKIVSADPRAAARAAAILKQHDYECYTKIMVKRRHGDAKRRHSSIDDFAKDARRRSVANAGVGKEDRERERQAKRRRSTLGMGVIGDRVIIPGSPAITLPELLEQAEKEVARDSPVKQVTPGKRKSVEARDPFKTPLPFRLSSDGSFLHQGVVDEDGTRQWTKEEWKLLDSCFTDERLEVGQQQLVTSGGLAPVDMVQPDDVVDRFIEMMGGEQVVTAFGEAWRRDSLTQRVCALQKKQRSGNVAPPTTPFTPHQDAALGGANRRPSMEVPDFTPLGRRAPPPRKTRPLLPQPIMENAPFSKLPPESERARKLPASLLAPRYSHLLEEAIIVNQEVSTISANLNLSPPSEEASTEEESAGNESSVDDMSFEQPAYPQTPATFGNRVKGFLFSYLPTASKTAPAAMRKPRLQRGPGLPLPPPDVLERPRGPVTTPVRPPLPKTKHPKELVNLNPAPIPDKPSLIPRLLKPQRLVELHHVPIPPAPERVIVPRPRRSSGGSVKDLVRNFEQMKGQERERAKSSLGKMRGVKKVGSDRPGWKP